MPAMCDISNRTNVLRSTRAATGVLEKKFRRVIFLNDSEHPASFSTCVRCYVLFSVVHSFVVKVGKGAG
jgi:hypothetical protein